MPITVIANVKVKPGSEAAFESEAARMISYVKANEPGTLTYILHRSQADPSQYLFYEVYTDQTALAAHGGSEAMMQFFGAMGEIVAARPEITMYEEIDGKR